MARPADPRASQPRQRTSQTRYRDCPPDMAARDEGSRQLAEAFDCLDAVAGAGLRQQVVVRADAGLAGLVPEVEAQWSGARPSRSVGLRAACGRPCPRPRRPSRRSARRSRSPARNRRARRQGEPIPVRVRRELRQALAAGAAAVPTSQRAQRLRLAAVQRPACERPALHRLARQHLAGSASTRARAAYRPGTTPARPRPAVAPARSCAAGSRRRPRRRGSRPPRPSRRGCAPAPAGSRRPPAARDRRRTPSRPPRSPPRSRRRRRRPEVAV